jgi:large subunit ribosomal protein L23
MRNIINPLTTEKAVTGIEKENKLTFVVRMESTRESVKKEVESEYAEKVLKVTILVTPKNQKKAVVKFKREGAASDLAAKLKVI